MRNFNISYIGQRNDILNFIPPGVRRVLDIGCSAGNLGYSIKNKLNAEVCGIELNRQMADDASKKLDKVLVDDIETLNLTEHFPKKYFDCIIFADILEHLKDPWDVLKNTRNVLSDTGLIIASIPNVRHHSTIINLLIKGYWPYRNRGIHDKTHLRFFTLRNIKEMFESNGFQLAKISRKYRIIEKPHPYNKYSKYFAISIFKELLTFQYLVVAGKKF